MQRRTLKNIIYERYKQFKQEYVWALSFGNIRWHLKTCFLWNEWWVWPINWLEKDYRYFGPDFTWYDGPHYTFGFWYFNISSSPEMPSKEDQDSNSYLFITESRWKKFIEPKKKSLIKKLKKLKYDLAKWVG